MNNNNNYALKYCIQKYNNSAYLKYLINIFIIIIFIVLLLLKLFNLYFSCKLYYNIDDYVLVYNFIKKQSLLVIFSYNKLFLNKTIYQSKSFSKYRLMGTMNNNTQLNELLKKTLDLFNKVSTDLNLIKTDSVLVKELENLKFISCLSIIDNDKKNKCKEIIVSTNFYVGSINIEEILYNLKKRDKFREVHIVVVSWEFFLNNFNLKVEEKKKIEIKKYESVNEYGYKYVVNVHTTDYKTFFENVEAIKENLKSDFEKENNKTVIELNPIIIFQGLHWELILYLFKLNNFTVHGGSITRRHKLSIVEYRLAQFLDLMNYNNKTNFYDLYVEKLLSSNTYDVNYYNHLKSNTNKDFTHTQPLILNYFKLNNIIFYEAKLYELEKKILEKQTSITSIESKKESLENIVNNVSNEETDIFNQISYYKNRLEQANSKKHKASLTGRIKKNREILEKIKKEREEDKKELYKLPSILNTSIVELNKLRIEKEEINKKLLSEINTESSTILNKNDNLNNSIISSPSIPDGRGVTNRRYHSLSIKRSFSTKAPIRQLNFSIDSPSYSELQRIIYSYPLDNQTQIKIESFLINQGSLLLQNKLNQNLEINYDKLNPNILKTLRTSLEDLNLLVDNLRKNISLQLLQNKKEFINETFDLLNNIDNETLISYMLGRFLKIISQNNLLNNNTYSSNVSIDLTKDLVNFYILKEFKKIKNSDNDSLSIFKNENKNRFGCFENEKFLFLFGMTLFGLLLEVKLIDMEVIQIDRDTKHTVFIPNKIISEKLTNNLNFLDLPYKIPMIVKPKEYGRDLKTGRDILGGYLLNDIELVTPLIIKNPELKDQSLIENKNILFNMVNNISSVGFKINQPVLDFIMEYGLEHNLIIDPNYIHPFETIKKKLTLSQKKILYSFLSKKNLELNILGLAHIFNNVPEFFIPVRIDNRGRIYCVADYLNYQSTELAKSLLLFSKGEKIYKNDTIALNYLKIFGANCFGNGIDKKSYKERVEWLNNNEENILNFKNGILINQAESKLLFIAFCFEYLNYKNSLNNNNTFFISHFPIQLDATCNGYQHLSLLTSDDSLAVELNLFPSTDQDTPKDFYTFVGLKLTDFFKKQILEIKENKLSDENLDTYEKLLKLKFHRKLVKSSIMVKPYNASIFQMCNYIKEHFLEIRENNNKFFVVDDNKDIYFTSHDLFILTNTINKIIYVEYPKLKTINTYLKRIAVICSILNIPIIWTLPSGLIVNQYYEDSEAIRLKPFTFKKNTFKLLIGNNKLNKAKQIRALMPNLIHSLDATSLALLIEKYFKSSNSKNFYSIHDCFAVTGNNIEFMIRIIKYVYLQIYSESNYLRKFDEGVIESIKLHFGKDAFNDEKKHIKFNGFDLEYPDIESVIEGQLDKNNILHSNYIIS